MIHENTDGARIAVRRLAVYCAGAMASLAVSAAAVDAGAAVLVVGGPGDSNTGNAFPFGGWRNGWGPEYQQVYAASDFAGPIRITALQFYNYNYHFAGEASPPGTFKISLSTTASGVNGLDSVNLSNNYGADQKVVYDATLPSVALGVLELSFTRSFDYNPGLGNLLVSVYSTDTTPLSSASIYFDSLNFGNGAGLFSRAFHNDVPNNSIGWGLVTGFVTSPVPEPTTWTSLLIGFGLAGAGLRRRRSAVAV